MKAINSIQNFREAQISLTNSLKKIHSEGEAKSIVRIVFEDIFRIYSTENQSVISDSQIQKLKKVEARLLNHEPVQYIIGQADFYGLKFNVNPNVLIPRSETEELVYWILESGFSSNIQVLDIGTGSGCIPITLKKKQPNWQISACDVSPEAVETAKSNADLNQTEIELLTLDILDKSNWDFERKLDLIVSNPPYIPNAEKAIMPENVLENEPHLALFVEDENPLIFYDMISDFALQNLKTGGFLYFEMNEFNANSVKEMLIRKNFKNTEIRKDIYGKNRMIRTQK